MSIAAQIISLLFFALASVSYILYLVHGAKAQKNEVVRENRNIDADVLLKSYVYNGSLKASRDIPLMLESLEKGGFIRIEKRGEETLFVKAGEADRSWPDYLILFYSCLFAYGDSVAGKSFSSGVFIKSFYKKVYPSLKRYCAFKKPLLDAGSIRRAANAKIFMLPLLIISVLMLFITFGTVDTGVLVALLSLALGCFLSFRFLKKKKALFALFLALTVAVSLALFIYSFILMKANFIYASIYMAFFFLDIFLYFVYGEKCIRRSAYGDAVLSQVLYEKDEGECFDGNRKYGEDYDRVVRIISEYDRLYGMLNQGKEERIW